MKNCLDLWISHCLSSSLFLIFLTIAHINRILSLSYAFFAKMIVRIKLKSLLKRFKCFMIFLQKEMTISFFMISLNKFRIFFKTNLIIFFSSLKLHQLNINLTNIAIIFGNFWISSNSLFILLKSLRKFTFLIKSSTLLVMLLAELRVYVLFGLFLFLDLFKFLHFILHLRITIL